MIRNLAAALFAMIVLPVHIAVAQNVPQPVQNIAESSPDTIVLSQKEFWAAVVVMIFSVLVLVSASVFKKHASFTEENIIRMIALVLIVSGTLFLVTLGYTAQQISPALGILGTIAGYMLGRSEREKKGDEQK
jgi:hypothetical protein